MRPGQLTHRTCPTCGHHQPWHHIGVDDTCTRCAPLVAVRRHRLAARRTASTEGTTVAR